MAVVVVVVVHIVVIGITPPDWGQATWLEREKGQGAAVTHRAAKDGVGEAAERYRITQGATWTTARGTISRRYESKELEYKQRTLHFCDARLPSPPSSSAVSGQPIREHGPCHRCPALAPYNSIHRMIRPRSRPATEMTVASSRHPVDRLDGHSHPTTSPRLVVDEFFPIA